MNILFILVFFLWTDRIPPEATKQSGQNRSGSRTKPVPEAPSGKMLMETGYLRISNRNQVKTEGSSVQILTLKSQLQLLVKNLRNELVWFLKNQTRCRTPRPGRDQGRSPGPGRDPGVLMETEHLEDHSRCFGSKKLNHKCTIRTGSCWRVQGAPDQSERGQRSGLRTAGGSVP